MEQSSSCPSLQTTPVAVAAERSSSLPLHQQQEVEVVLIPSSLMRSMVAAAAVHPIVQKRVKRGGSVSFTLRSSALIPSCKTGSEKIPTFFALPDDPLDERAPGGGGGADFFDLPRGGGTLPFGLLSAPGGGGGGAPPALALPPFFAFIFSPAGASILSRCASWGRCEVGTEH